MKIAILGAGLMGRVLGMRLYQSGYTNLTLIDEDNLTGTKSPAFIAAGMLAPLSESVAGGKTIYNLGKNSLSLWQKYLTDLDVPELCINKGTLLLANQNFMAETRHYLNKITFNSDETPAYYNKLNQSELNDLEPGLANFNYCYYLPSEGGLNARETFEVMGKYLTSRVNWLTEININKSNLIGNKLKFKNQIHQFDQIFDCRGLGAKDIFSELRGIRGEIIRVFAPQVNLSHPIRLFHPRHNIYIMPYAKNYYIIGASEIEAEDFSPISVISTLELLGSAYTVHKGFAEARIIETNSSCRPTLKNNLPQILVKENYIAINGLYRHGFLISPCLAENIISYLKNNKIKLNPEIWRN